MLVLSIELECRQLRKREAYCCSNHLSPWSQSPGYAALVGRDSAERWQSQEVRKKHLVFWKSTNSDWCSGVHGSVDNLSPSLWEP